MHFTRSAALAGLAAVPFAVAQTFTDCNPMEKTCPNDPGLNSASWSCDFTKGKESMASWSSAQGTTLSFDDNGAAFTINKKGQAPTISSSFYFFFGKVDVVMRAANGTGIVSSVVLESDDLDEIDWEWLGGDTAQVQTNYFGKGDTTTYDRGGFSSVSNPQTETHTYTLDWTKDKIEWSIDGNVVRTLAYADAQGGKRFPQTPMRLKLGNWIAGDPDTNAKGTIEWAGGETDFNTAPFVMYVESVKVTNYNPAKEYQWSDKSGSYQSIKLLDTSSDSSNDDGPSVIAGSPVKFTKSATIKTTAAVSDAYNTVAPTSSLSVKQAQAQGTAAIVTSNGSNGPNTTASNAASTLSSKVNSAGSKITGSASGSKSGSANASGSAPAQQTGAGSMNAVAAGGLSLVGLVMAFFAL